MQAVRLQSYPGTSPFVVAAQSGALVENGATSPFMLATRTAPTGPEWTAALPPVARHLTEKFRFSETPTGKFLSTDAHRTNWYGSPVSTTLVTGDVIQHQYEDGSVMTADPENGEFVYWSSEGLSSLTAEQRILLNQIARGALSLENLHLIGSGNFSEAYSAPINGTDLVIKVTRLGKFLKKELSEEMSHYSPEAINGFGRITVQHIDLKTCLDLQDRLSKAGYSVPTFYGCILIEGASALEDIVEVQFMQRFKAPTYTQLDQAISLHPILDWSQLDDNDPLLIQRNNCDSDDAFLESVDNADREIVRRLRGIVKEIEYEIDWGKLPHHETLKKAREYFDSDKAFLQAIVRDRKEFIRSVVTGEFYNIADIGEDDNKTDNLFVLGYDTEKGKFVFGIIDPIIENRLISNMHNRHRAQRGH